MASGPRGKCAKDLTGLTVGSLLVTHEDPENRDYYYVKCLDCETVERRNRSGLMGAISLGRKSKCKKCIKHVQHRNAWATHRADLVRKAEGETAGNPAPDATLKLKVSK